jgi:hypothetical protein
VLWGSHYPGTACLNRKKKEGEVNLIEKNRGDDNGRCDLLEKRSPLGTQVTQCQIDG